MALTREQKYTIKYYYEKGSWLKLAMLIIQLGIEAIAYLRELRKNKGNAE